MNTKKLLLWIFSFSLISCMEEATTIYDQPLPQMEVIDVTVQDTAEVPTGATPEKMYSWLTQMQGPNGLVESAESTNFVSLYDNALAALAFMAEGDLDRAEAIFDFFNARLSSEFQANNGGFFQYREGTGDNGSRIWMGDNAWLLLALNHYQDITQSDRYQVLSSELEAWLRSLQDQDGGLRGGTNENGTPIPKVTEGIITAFNAVRGFDDFHKRILVFLGEQRWDPSEKVLTTHDDTPAYDHALDLYSLGYLILEDYPAEVLQKADRFYNSQTATTSKKVISGYCFDDDRDVVWLEGTAQMAMAFSKAGQSGSTQNILMNIEAAFIGSTAIPGIMGLPYTTNPGTNFGAIALWAHADTAPAISSTAWYLMVKNGFDPFHLENRKNMAEEYKFWAGTGVN